MRICLSIKTGNRRQSSKQPGRAAYRYPGSHRVPSPNAPYRHPQRAALHNQPVTSVPGFGPARRAHERRPQRTMPLRGPLGLPDFSQHRHNRAALEPRTAGRAGTPTRVPGVAGDRIRLARPRVATGWQFRQAGAQPHAHPARASGSNPPIVWPRPPPSDPSHGRGGSQPPHPLTARMVSNAPAVRPGTGGAKPPGVICCQVVQAADSGDGLSFSQAFSAATTRRAAPPPW